MIDWPGAVVFAAPHRLLVGFLGLVQAVPWQGRR